MDGGRQEGDPAAAGRVMRVVCQTEKIIFPIQPPRATRAAHDHPQPQRHRGPKYVSSSSCVVVSAVECCGAQRKPQPRLLIMIASDRSEPLPPSYILGLSPAQFVVCPSSRIQVPSNCLVIGRPDGEVALVRRENSGARRPRCATLTGPAATSLLNGEYIQFYGILGKFPLFSGSPFCDATCAFAELRQE